MEKYETEVIEIEADFKKFRKCFMDLIPESDLSEDEMALYTIFRGGMEFMRQYMVMLSLNKFDPELARKEYLIIFGEDWPEVPIDIPNEEVIETGIDDILLCSEMCECMDDECMDDVCSDETD
jgi:hypothetical protein